jgi:hypothetical protein
MKNKRGRLYKLGELDVPDKFGYLKTNASKRDPNGSWKKRASSSGTTKSTNKCVRKGKGRATMTVQSDEDSEEEEEEGEAEGMYYEEEEEGMYDEEEEDVDR